MWTVRNEIGCAAHLPSEMRRANGRRTTKKQKTRTGRAECRFAAEGAVAVHHNSSAIQNRTAKMRAIRSSRTL